MISRSLPFFLFIPFVSVIIWTEDALAVGVVGGGDGTESAMTPKTKSWTLHHRVWSPGGSDGRLTTTTAEWSVRGKVELTVDSSSSSNTNLEVTNSVDSLSESFAQALSFASSRAVWYQLKLVPDETKTTDVAHNEILASVPACNVRRANFRDEFVLQLQDGTAHALSMTYMPLVSPLAPSSCAEYTSLPDALKFESRISFDTAIPGMIVGKPRPNESAASVGGGAAAGTAGKPSSPHANRNLPPPGLKWMAGATSRPKNGPGTGGGGGFAPPPDSSLEGGIMGFFKRYWYYIVPLMLIQIWGSSPPEPPPTNENAAATEAGAAAPGGGGASTPKSAGPPPPQAVRRRGKKE